MVSTSSAILLAFDAYRKMLAVTVHVVAPELLIYKRKRLKLIAVPDEISSSIPDISISLTFLTKVHALIVEPISA
jgi:hypothetical protein